MSQREKTSSSGEIDVENNMSPASNSVHAMQNQPSSNENETTEKRTVTVLRWALVCVAIFSANILYGLDTTIAADIQAAAFYINSVIFGAMSPVYLFVLPSLPRRPQTASLEKLRSFDWVGITLNAGLYVSFTLALTFGGSIWDWTNGRFVACIVVFGLTTTLCCLTQRYSFLTTPIDRIFPCEFLRNPQLILLYTCMACYRESTKSAYAAHAESADGSR
ncbi:hypothetical protein BJX70DRAFT_395709 [Aspergillus crustosus]